MKEPEKQSVSPEAVWDRLSPQAKFVSICMARPLVGCASDVTVQKKFIEESSAAAFRDYKRIMHHPVRLDDALGELVEAGIIIKKRSLFDVCERIVRKFDIDVHATDNLQAFSRRRKRIVALASQRIIEAAASPKSVKILMDDRYRFTTVFKQFFDTSFVWNVDEQELPRAWLEIDK